MCFHWVYFILDGKFHISSILRSLDQNNFSVVIWNTLGQSVKQLVEIPVKQSGAEVRDLSTGKIIGSQIIPSLPGITNYGPNKNCTFEFLLQWYAN